MNVEGYLDYYENYINEHPVLCRIQIDYFKNFHECIINKYESDFLNYNTELAFGDIVFNYSKKILRDLHEEFIYAMNYPKTFKSRILSDSNKRVSKILRVYKNEEGVISELVDNFQTEHSRMMKTVKDFEQSMNLFKVFENEEVFETSKNILVNILFKEVMSLCKIPKSESVKSMNFLNDYLSSKVVYFTRRFSDLIKKDYENFVQEYELNYENPTMFI